MELKVTSGTGMKLGKTRVLERLLVIDDTATFTLSPTYSGSDPGKMTITDTFPANYIDIMSGDTNGWACTITHQTLTRTKKCPPQGLMATKPLPATTFLSVISHTQQQYLAFGTTPQSS